MTSATCSDSVAFEPPFAALPTSDVAWFAATAFCACATTVARTVASFHSERPIWSASALIATVTTSAIAISAICVRRLYQPLTRSIVLSNHVSTERRNRGPLPCAWSMKAISARRTGSPSPSDRANLSARASTSSAPPGSGGATVSRNVSANVLPCR